jgi:PAS domain S-box-containing protein
MKLLAAPVRLFGEIVLIIAAAEVAVMTLLPEIAPGVHGPGAALLDVVLLVLLSGPVVYWRCVITFQQPHGSGARREGTRIGLGPAIGMTAAAQVLGLAITAAGVVWQKSAIDATAATRFEMGAERIKAEVLRRLNLPLYGLRGLRGTYAASGSVTRAEFRKFVDASNIDTEYHGIRGFGLIERVARADLSAFVAREQADAAPDFAVRTSGSADDLYVIKTIEPLNRNRAAWGYDIGQEGVRREAAERAVATGEPTLSGRITLVQDGNQGSGFLYLLPIYRRGTDPVTLAQRRAALIGLVYAPIVVNEVMDGVRQAGEGLLDFEVWESDRQNGGLIFDLDQHLAGTSGAIARKAVSASKYQSSAMLEVGGRILTLQVTGTPAFEASVDRSNLALIGVGGAAVSTMGALTVWLLAVGRLRAQRRAQYLTADLDRLARVAQHTTNSVTIADAQMRITWVNAGFTNVTGYTLEEAKGRTPAELLGSGKSDPAAIETLIRSVALGVACRVEVINRAKDGREYWIDTEVQPTRDSDGLLTGFMEIGTDITTQKQTQARLEAAIRASDTLLTTLHVHAIVSVSDRQGIIMEVNDAFCDISGYSIDELIGKSHGIVNSGVHPPEFWAEMWRQISSGLSWRGDICNRAKDGSLYWVDSMIAPFIGDDGMVEKYVSIRTDITASKANQLQMAAMTDRLTLAIEGSSDGLWDWIDLRMSAQWWSPSYYALMGYTAEELPATIEAFNSILHPDHVAICSQAASDAFAGIREYDEEHLLLTKHQGYRWFRSRAKVYRDAQGKPVRMAGASQDIHDRKMAEQQLRDALARAQEASVAKSQFLANMSHEIRTPMNAILGMLKLLQSTELSVRQLDYAAKTEGAARSLLGLLNDILDFSKVEAGKMTLDPRPFRIDRLMRDLSVILSANVGSKDIEVLFDMDPAVPKSLVGDDMRLQQILINLGGNAIKFTSQGEVVLRVRVVAQSAHDVLLDFAMRDSGIGIAPENQAHIFSGFSQAEASTTRRFGGTGLGLAISSRLVSLLGGELQLESALGTGSTFHFQASFPLAQEVPDRAAEHRLPRIAPMRTLVVDDNPVARELMATMLRSLSWPVDVADRGALALEMVETRMAADAPYQVIFMDWQMPMLDGWQTTERIRTLTRDASIPPLVLMVTAHGRENLSQRSAQDQALLNGFLVKPVTASMLCDAVADANAASVAAALGHNPAAPVAPPKNQRLRGLRLLVVEDNKINQVVAKGLLSQEGADIQLADNGQLGVDALANGAVFDAVLMDVQMPVMDGYEATRAIRTQLGLTDLPIIAMTANAMASDRMACLAAGMNDHVGKPFELDQLVDLLLRYCSGARAVPSPAKPTHQAEAPATFPPGDLDLDGALARMGGDSTMLAGVLQTFARDMALVPSTVQALLSKGESLEATRALHTLKGLAATVGARHLSLVAAAVERQLKQASAQAGASALVQELQDAVDATTHALAPVLQRSTPASATAAAAHTTEGDAALLADLQSLCDMLEKSDMSALELHARIRQVHDAALGPDSGPLDAAMAELEFERAAKLCSALIAQLRHNDPEETPPLA